MSLFLDNAVKQIPDKVLNHINAKTLKIQYCHRSVLSIDLPQYKIKTNLECEKTFFTIVIVVITSV